MENAEATADSYIMRRHRGRLGLWAWYVARNADPHLASLAVDGSTLDDLYQFTARERAKYHRSLVELNRSDPLDPDTVSKFLAIAEEAEHFLYGRRST
jgi:hypothetical protein